MNEAELIGKLSRIFETHSLQRGEDDWELEDLLEDLENDNVAGHRGPSSSLSPKRSSGGFHPSMRSPSEGDFFAGFHTGGYSGDVNGFADTNATRSPGRMMTTPTLNIDRPKPVEVWEKKIAVQRGHVNIRKTPKLTGEQWERLADKMHQSNRVKQSAMIKEQNQGLAMELGGFQFKPRINQTSLDLSATMKSLQHRLPEMLAERKKILEYKRKEAADAEVAECSFAPTRTGSKMSDQYLQKIGRNRPVKPDDLYKYEEERQRRIAIRQQIVAEVESKELTFKPQLGERSEKLQRRARERMAESANSLLPPALLSQSTQSADLERLSAMIIEGPVLVIESEHPYRNNCDEYTTVSVPGAISYKVSFSPETRTEAVFDFVKFFHDETHTDFFGAGKYTGGMHNSSANWPGQASRPPLVIPAEKFVLYFHSNAIHNDYGFRLFVTPLFLDSSSPGDPLTRTMLNSPSQSKDGSLIPQISMLGQKYQHKEKGRVHERLYQDGVMKKVQEHNNMVDLMQTKLNISLKPWELTRNTQTSYSQSLNKSNMHKSPLSDQFDELLCDEDAWVESEGDVRMMVAEVERPQRRNKSSLCVVEFDDSLGSLWKQLRTV